MDWSWRFFVYIAGTDATLYLKQKVKRKKIKKKKKKKKELPKGKGTNLHCYTSSE